MKAQPDVITGVCAPGTENHKKKGMRIGLEFGMWTKCVLVNGIYTLAVLAFYHWFKS